MTLISFVSTFSDLTHVRSCKQHMHGELVVQTHDEGGASLDPVFGGHLP